MSKFRFIKNFNNYFNRINMDITSIVGMVNTYVDYTLRNFNPNDDVQTSHIENWSETWTPDYMLELDETDNTILSRWFVTESVRTRLNQYEFILRRDLIEDRRSIVLNSYCFIERGMIYDINNPLLYNSEGFSFNQIKKNEVLLKDGSKNAWYVLYFKDSSQNSGQFAPPQNYDVKINGSLASSIYNTGTQKYCDNFVIKAYFEQSSNNVRYERIIYGPNRYYYQQTDIPANATFDNYYSVIASQLNTVFAGQYSVLCAKAMLDGQDSTITKSNYNNLMKATSSGIKVYSEADQKTYLITASKTVETVNYTSNPLTGELSAFVKSLYSSTTLNVSYKPVIIGDLAHYSYTKTTFTITATEIQSGNYDWEIYDGKASTEDSDFDMIAIPYYDIKYINNNVTYTASGAISSLLVKNIIQKSTQAKLVDVQLLPYCPVQNLINSSGYINLDGADSSTFDIVSSQDPSVTDTTFMLYVTKSNFTFDISYSITVPNEAIERKIMNETSLYKIVSPNYNGSFEFSPAKNSGVDYFNVDVTLIPYQPYIHINPNFKGLYGNDYNDARGLICGGDFSLPMRSDQWETYQINNKNYQNIFDRQMKNMDFNQRQERISEIASLVSGTVQGGVSGGVAGGMMGGPYAAIAGAIVGTATSAVGGAIDYSLMEDRQKEQRSLANDLFQYQLGNIKALPDNINKVTPLTYNNKLWPFLEVYEATDEEKSLLRSYIAHRSMTINKIDFISNYFIEGSVEKTLVKGQIISMFGLDMSSHEANEIYKEINEGVKF